MYNSVDSHASGRQGSRNVLRGGPQQNGVQYSSGQQQWGVNEGQQFQQGGTQFQHGGSQFQQGGPQFQQFPSGGDSYPQYGDSGSGQFGADEVKNSKEFGQLRTMFSQPTVQPSHSGVRHNARSSNKPVFRKSTSTTSELDEMGWIPKNKPPVHSQNRYMPAHMRSPPVNRKHTSDTPDYQQSSSTPAWQGTLRSAGGPRAWEIQDQPMSPSHPADQWSNGGRPQSSGGRRARPSPPRDESDEPHSARFYQLVNENNDQMEQYMKLPQRGTAYSGGNTSHGGHSSTVSYEAGNYQY